MLHDAEGHDGRYRRFPDWLMSMDRLPSCPDLVLLEGTEQGPGGQIYGIDKDARLHLVEVTFTTDFALVDRVASKTAQHERLCRCLADAGWSNVELHLFIVGHTGVMGWDNAQALLDLGVPPSQVQPVLEAIAVMGCRYSCEMLKACWRGPADISVPSPDAPNPAAVHLQNLLNGTTRRSPPCLLHMAARRPPSHIANAAAKRPDQQNFPQHGAARKRQRSPDCANPPKRARVHANSLPSSSTAASPPAPDLSLSQNLRKCAKLAAKCDPAPQSCSPQCHPVLLPGARGLLSSLSTRPRSDLGLMPGMLCMFLRELRLFLGRLVQLCILLLGVPVPASVWLMSGWCTTLVAGVADCYLAQGLPWLIPFTPRIQTSHSFIHSFILRT